MPYRCLLRSFQRNGDSERSSRRMVERKCGIGCRMSYVAPERDVVSCAAVGKSRRCKTKEIVRTPEQCGLLMFPMSLKQLGGPGPRDSPLQSFIERDRQTSTYLLYLGLSPVHSYTVEYIVELAMEGENIYSHKYRVYTGAEQEPKLRILVLLIRKELEPDMVLLEYLKQKETDSLAAELVRGVSPLPLEQHKEPNSVVSKQGPEILNSNKAYGHVLPKLASDSSCILRLCSDLCDTYKKDFISVKPCLTIVKEACPPPQYAEIFEVTPMLFSKDQLGVEDTFCTDIPELINTVDGDLFFLAEDEH
ncbi:hypothetical protein POM88_041690 [Heracleum sosnowskyi]|uniref:Uncharacterized protein n=1 Tax=Heracleum sosnowskyi TaxID=360622 RepID=A0AAD8HFC9_9APIA|nr:hypothetical protein POM88_041690 [Heracleum sosnowskyi]